ncbi:hypothetical protein, partial [Limosilactobacillus albertensis]|uniref:hypothetical protein n=1 Tax=Limosilactobacillus albertensis TaxID=2759752 RepID=UPI001C7283B9
MIHQQIYSCIENDFKLNDSPNNCRHLLLMSLDLVECVSEASARNKKPPALRVGDKNYIKKASFA